MAWRTVVIANPARIRIRNDQLAVEQEQTTTLPLEDIAVLLLESPEVVLSASALNRFAELGVLLLVCNAKHMPSFAGVPFAPHSRLAMVQRLQLNASLPFQKRCWQLIIKQKIENQAECLRILEKAGADRIGAMAASVGSGDPTNIESVASREHFQEAFGQGFSRGHEDGINSALNYGYAVLRGAVARALASHGFILAQGIHHHSELNQFNLADDFLEPLRPLVDQCAARMTLGDELTKEHRELLVALLHAEVLVDGQRHGAMRAAEMMAGSFLSACKAKDPRLLKLPGLLPLKTHSYE